MRPLRIFAIGLVGLIFVFGIQIFFSYFLIAAALCPFLLLMVGQLYLPRSRRSIQVWLNPVVLTAQGELIPAEPGMPLGRLSGKEISYSYFKQRHDFRIVTHRFWLLSLVWIDLAGDDRHGMASKRSYLAPVFIYLSSSISLDTGGPCLTQLAARTAFAAIHRAESWAILCTTNSSRFFLTGQLHFC
jgi:hypothetical protein